MGEADLSKVIQYVGVPVFGGFLEREAGWYGSYCNAHYTPVHISITHCGWAYSKFLATTFSLPPVLRSKMLRMPPPNHCNPHPPWLETETNADRVEKHLVIA